MAKARQLRARMAENTAGRRQGLASSMPAGLMQDGQSKRRPKAKLGGKAGQGLGGRWLSHGRTKARTSIEHGFGQAQS